MTEVTAYNNPNAPINRQWIAYIVMDNGQLWGVYAIGSSEDEAKSKIAKLWESERQKANAIASAYKPEPKPASSAFPASWLEPPLANSPKPSGRGAHFIGMTWLIKAENAETMITSGDWERGGPRSK